MIELTSNPLHYVEVLFTAICVSMGGPAAMESNVCCSSAAFPSATQLSRD
jgi:hypothetical protein